MFWDECDYIKGLTAVSVEIMQRRSNKFYLTGLHWVLTYPSSFVNDYAQVFATEFINEFSYKNSYIQVQIK